MAHVRKEGALRFIRGLRALLGDFHGVLTRGEKKHLFLRFLAFGDVPADTKNQLLTAEPCGVAADFDVVNAPVPAPVLRFEVRPLLVDCAQHLHEAVGRNEIVPIENREAPYRLEGAPEHLREFSVGFVHSAVLVEDDDPVSGLLQEETPPERFVREFLRLFFIFRDIKEKDGEVVLPVGVGVHPKPSAEELRVLLELF